MEFEVRVVGGTESCFVSLPLHLIQTLQSTHPGPLPPSLALELRSPDGDRRWHVAWSGSASASSAIEIAQQYAECIDLLDRSTVRVRAVPSLPKATLVMIEPHTEDDWEILELNADHAEAAILKQVSVVHEAMRFPLWLHGHNIVSFVVTSIFPKESVVQLVPGTEVAVAPKRRKNNVDSSEGSSLQSSIKEITGKSRALLRVQDPGGRLNRKSEVDGIELDIVLTSVVLVHPETASTYSFKSHQLVFVMPKLPLKESLKNHELGTPKKHTNTKNLNSGTPTEQKDCRQAIVRLLLSESVAKGHVMLSQSLRLYLRAGLHSWTYLKSCNINLKKDIPMLSLSPCQFKTIESSNASDKNSLELLDGRKNLKTKNLFLNPSSNSDMDDIDWSIHERVVATLSDRFRIIKDEEAYPKFNHRKGLQSLLRAWYFAQCDAIAIHTEAGVHSLVFGNETLIHFQVKGYKFGIQEKIQVSCNGSLENKSTAGEPLIDILYVLSTSEESQHGARTNAYEILFDGENKNSNLRGLDLLLGKLQLGDGVCLYSIKEKPSNKYLDSTISSLSWMGTAASDVVNRLHVLLSPASGRLFGAYDLPFPGHVFLYGPPGSGKTLLATAVAKSVEEHEDILGHIVFVRCSKLALGKPSTIRQMLSGYISEALDNAPSVLIFDDLDNIVSSSSDLEGAQPSSSVIALTEFLTDVMDEYEEKRRSSCGIGPIALIATAQSLTNVPQSLTSSGRFDFHVQLPAPAASERAALLKHEIRKRSLKCFDDVLLDIASKCDGYDAYDLEILVDRAVHAAIGRFVNCDLADGEHRNPTLIKEDFLQAMHEFLPVAMRDITKPAFEGGRSGWEDVGGLIDIQTAIKEMIELPSKYPSIFAQAPLRLRSNVLLYGPPGCGKTHIVGAAAAACSLRFISVKGPELLNKYIGASEQAVRDIFSKAAAAAPCLLFFDEFDSIAPKRGHDNTGVTDRVVNQFLTELDGVEVLTGVFVFAATSRPDLLDAALLRPGRLDRLLFCDFPSQHERLDILTVLSRKLPLADDIDLDAVAHMTEGFSGADLQALLSDAQLAAVHEFLGSGDSIEPGKIPTITNQLLNSVASKARPSVSEAEKQRLYGIYNQFLDSKRSVAAKSRDAKGKRATLA